MFKFEAEILPTTKGVQSTKWDSLLVHFNEPGKTLFFEESEVTRAAASQCAKRMMALDGERKFHSGYHVIKKKTFVRVRPEGELVEKEEPEEVLEQGQLPVE